MDGCPHVMFHKDDFFKDDTGRSVLPTKFISLQAEAHSSSYSLKRILSNASTTTNASQASSTPTISSTDTVISSDGRLKLLLEDLCKIVDEHRSMQLAEIVATEGYSEWTGTVVHRFLILELQRVGRKSIWLRIDRQRAQDVSALRFLAARASTPANDTVGASNWQYTLLKLSPIHF